MKRNTGYKWFGGKEKKKYYVVLNEKCKPKKQSDQQDLNPLCKSFKQKSPPPVFKLPNVPGASLFITVEVALLPADAKQKAGLSTASVKLSVEKPKPSQQYEDATLKNGLLMVPERMRKHHLKLVYCFSDRASLKTT